MGAVLGAAMDGGDDRILVIIVLLVLTSPIWITAVAWLIDRSMTRAHRRSLERREDELFSSLFVTNLRLPPEGYRARGARLYTGEVVMGCSHWRRFLSGFRHFVGGRMRSLEDLLTRARREALLRALERARRSGANCVLNVRFETATLGAGAGGRQASGVMVEVVASLTAVKLEDDRSRSQTAAAAAQTGETG